MKTGRSRCGKMLSCFHSCEELAGSTHTCVCTRKLKFYLECGHPISVDCSNRPKLSDLKCVEQCGKVLKCKHPCKKNCAEKCECLECKCSDAEDAATDSYRQALDTGSDTSISNPTNDDLGTNKGYVSGAALRTMRPATATKTPSGEAQSRAPIPTPGSPTLEVEYSFGASRGRARRRAVPGISSAERKLAGRTHPSLGLGVGEPGSVSGIKSNPGKELEAVQPTSQIPKPRKELGSIKSTSETPKSEKDFGAVQPTSETAKSGKEPEVIQSASEIQKPRRKLDTLQSTSVIPNPDSLGILSHTANALRYQQLQLSDSLRNMQLRGSSNSNVPETRPKKQPPHTQQDSTPPAVNPPVWTHPSDWDGVLPTNMLPQLNDVIPANAFEKSNEYNGEDTYTFRVCVHQHLFPTSFDRCHECTGLHRGPTVTLFSLDGGRDFVSVIVNNSAHQQPQPDYEEPVNTLEGVDSENAWKIGMAKCTRGHLYVALQPFCDVCGERSLPIPKDVEDYWDV